MSLKKGVNKLMRSKGDESAQDIAKHYNAREMEKAYREQKTLERSNNVKNNSDSHKSKNLSPDPTQINQNGFSWATNFFTGRVETVNVKHKPTENGKNNYKLFKSLSVAIDLDGGKEGNENEDETEQDEDKDRVHTVNKLNTKNKVRSLSPTKRTYSDDSGVTASHFPKKHESVRVNNENENADENVHEESQKESPIVKENSGILASALKKISNPTTTLPKAISDMKQKYMTAIYQRSEENKNKVTENKTLKSVDSKQSMTMSAAKADFAFKQAMLEKYNMLQGPGGGLVRKDSSFNTEATKLLLIGPQKSGKSTLFKEMMSLAGLPPNYARAYVPTKEPVEKTVRISGNDFEVIDCGGKDVTKWRFYLSHADLIVFVVAIDEYDKKNKMGRNMLEESLELWDSILGNFQIISSKIVLVLNKSDRFNKKLATKNVPLEVYGKSLDGFDYEKGIQYIKDLFIEKLKASDHENDVIVEVTNAVDSDNTREFLERITDEIAICQKTNKWKNLL